MNLTNIVIQFTQTLSRFFSGMRFIRKNGLSKYYLFPIGLSILLWYGGYSLVENLVDMISTWTHGYLEIEAHPTGEGFFSSFSESWEMFKLWINGASTLLLALVLKLVFWIVLGVVMKYVLLILLSPVLAYISEKTESILTGKEYPFDVEQLVRDSFRGIIIATRNFMIEMTCIILFTIFAFFVPAIAPITAILGFIIGSYFYGYSMIDYYSERQKMSITASSKFVWNNAGMAIGLGLMISLAIKLPLIGFLMASFTSIISAVTAVLLISSKQESQPQISNVRGVIDLKNEI